MSVVYALAPVLGIYSIGVPFLTLSQTLLLFLFVLCMVKSKMKLPIYFRSFIFYSIAISIISFFTPWVVIEESIHDILSLVLFFFFLFCAIRFVNYEIFRKIYLYLGIASVLFFFFQFFMLQIGIPIIGILPFLPLSIGEGNSEYIAHQMMSDRASGFFLEPAHYATFMSNILLMLIFNTNSRKKDILLAILVTLSILICKSATGYVLLVAAWIMWAFVYRLSHNKHKLLWIFFMGAILFVVIVGISYNESLFEVVSRFNELSGENESSEHGRSSYIRTFRGYIPIMESGLFQQIFGNGLGTLMSYVSSHPKSKYLLLTEFNPNWINGVQYIIFTTGLVGFLLYAKQMLILYKRTTPLGKSFLMLIVLLFLSADSFYSVGAMLFVIINEAKQKHWVALQRQYKNIF